MIQKMNTVFLREIRDSLKENKGELAKKPTYPQKIPA